MSFIWLFLIGACGALILRSQLVGSTGLVTPGLRGEFFNRFGQVPTLYQDLCTRIPSTGASETYRWLGTVPQMREWGRGRLAKGLRAESYAVANQKYEATLEVDRDEIRDDQLGQIRVRTQELAVRAATHKDYMLAQLLINGASSGFNSYDGVTFFNAAHVSGASGSQDNDLAPSATDANNPTTTEFKASLKAAIATMLAFVDDQGQPMALSHSGLVCVVPPSMEFAAREAVNATIISNTSNVMAGVADVKPFPFLTTATTWYLCKTDTVVRPFVFQDREPVEFNALDIGSEEDFKHEKLLFGVRARYRLTYGYWQFCVRSVFA